MIYLVMLTVYQLFYCLPDLAILEVPVNEQLPRGISQHSPPEMLDATKKQLRIVLADNDILLVYS